ncbi:hypothetical protein D9613_012239 [Agrocybe pediades]|uniref:Nephrocystin 3-like N-terminal domain-containing protein n=1 Tax=Agrocybe pediades TaxID=84607 RepID=A0A8H4QER6_9AGAR|nr:hypothetical protein D9613_012239 [Agrocybe pediades]
MWMSGAAGAGKSSIARTVAEQCAREGKLLGCFFFSREDATRSSARRMVPTLSYQLMRVVPEVRPIITSIIEDHPLVLSQSITEQFQSLLFAPLQHALQVTPQNHATPTLVILDGLDECQSEEEQGNILDPLANIRQQFSLPLRVLVCSRPETQIVSSFQSTALEPITTRLILDDTYLPGDDIEIYLRDIFLDLKTNHRFKDSIPESWPTDKDIATLVRQSSGQFIYAATVVKYVSSNRHRPHQRLDVILKLRPPFKDGLPFTQLDALYSFIFSKVEDIRTVLDILAVHLLYRCSVTSIEDILCLERGDVEILLCDMGSLITFNQSTTDDHVTLSFQHASLEDFLCDETRSKDLFVDLPQMRCDHMILLLRHFSCKFQTSL